MNADSFMAQSPSTWINGFLHHRGLDGPDGRALYAYRCTATEFDSLAEVLSHSTPDGTINATTRAFVFYAAEWWQRQYDGHHWAWEPLLASIKWHIHYPDLYEPVRAALRWWRVDLVRLPTSIRYLGTFACQGGLPLGLVGDADSRVVQYLRAVLKHTAEYRKFVDDAIDLARDQQHLLRPPTLRRDYVFRLVADLIEAVLDLQNDAQGEDPISTLDQVRPGWRKTMPLALENERARDLLTGLLREAVQVRPPTDDFRVERFLRRTSVGWRLGARVRLPPSIPAEHLARHLNVSEGDLPPRLQVRVHGGRVRDVGLYAAQSDNFLLVARDTQSQTELWDTEAAAEVRLQFLSGDVVGEGVVPYRGTALGELPWAFRGDSNECPFIGEGSVSNRASEVVVLAPDGCTIDRVSALEESSEGESEGLDPSAGDNIRTLDRVLWRISKPTTIKAIHGRCMIRPSSGQAVEEDYRLEGQRCYDLESAWPLFRGTPRLCVSKAEQAPRTVPTNEVSWRQTGGEWQQRPNAFGLWEVRHMRGGELRYLGRVGIFPEQFRLSLAPGSDMSEGYLVLNGAEAVKISGHSQEAVVTSRIEGDEARGQVAARDAAHPPARVQLRLHWQGAEGLDVQVPFPGLGGRFLRDGKPLDQLSVDDLYGVRATTLSPGDSQKFWIEGELRALDLDGSLLRVAHFRLPLHKSGITHELPLIDSRPMIQLLLASSSSSDASVSLRIVDGFQHGYDAIQVNRFAAALEYDSGMALISVSPELDEGIIANFEAIPLARPGADSVPLDIVGPANAPHGAVIPQDMNMNEPWLVVLRHDDRVRVRPTVIGGRSSESVDLSTSEAEAPRLCEAVSLRDWTSRIRAIDAAMDAMLDAEDVHRVEEEWGFLTDTLLCAEGLPATSLNLLKVLVEKPNLLVRCMFRLESAPRQLLWRLENELPFSWLLIQREVWWTEARQAFERLRNQLADMPDGDQIASDHVCSILSEGVHQFRGLYTVACDIGFRLKGGRIPDPIVEEAQKKRDDKTQEQLNLRYSMDDWPTGDGRSEWAEELDQGELLNKLAIWQHEGEFRERQPIFDTPVAAAWCCFHSNPTDRMIFLVKRIRTHDPEWFDLAYEAAWFQFALMQDKSNI